MPRLTKRKLINLLNLGNFSKKQRTRPEAETDDAEKENLKVSEYLFINS